MKIWLILLMLLASPMAYSADQAKPPDTSPFDKSQDCMDRSTNSAAGDCVVQDKGKPHHLHPPRHRVKVPAPPVESSPLMAPPTQPKPSTPPTQLRVVPRADDK